MFLHNTAVRRRGKSSQLVVVLHAEGRTKDDVVSGPWRGAAEELEAALLAPSGTIATGPGPELGLDWFEDPSALVDTPALYERGVLEAVRGFLTGHEVDRERVWLAGEGHGALLAFDVALRSPGLFTGVVLRNGAIHPETPRDLARRAAALGLRVVFVADDGDPLVGEQVAAWLAELGFDRPMVACPAAQELSIETLLRQALAGK